MSTDQLQMLYAWLGSLLEERKADTQLPENPNVLEVRQIGQSSFQLELVKCGKANCKCASGKLHGPYWYEYWREADKVKKRYHGKRVPEKHRFR